MAGERATSLGPLNAYAIMNLMPTKYKDLTTEQKNRRKEALKRWRKRNQEQESKWAKEAYYRNSERNRLIVNEAKTIGCSRCGYDSCLAALDLHHRDPEAKVAGISKAVNSRWTVDRLCAEIAKCDVLCANCHRELHYIEGVSESSS